MNRALMVNQREWESSDRQRGRAAKNLTLVHEAGRAERERQDELRRRVQRGAMRSKRLMDAIVREKAMELR